MKKEKKKLNFHFSTTDKKLDETLHSFNGKVFWCQKENGDYSLYRIENNHPIMLTQLPNITYSIQKGEHMKNFFLSHDIHFDTKILKDDTITFVFYDPSHVGYIKNVSGPLYQLKTEEEFLFMAPIHQEIFPCKNMIIAAHESFMNHYEAIKEEEILYDFNKLSMDNGTCAFFERYPLDPSLHLTSSRYLIWKLVSNPNKKDMPLNPYTNEYTKDYTIECPLYRPTCNFILFDKYKIQELYQKNGVQNLMVSLPESIISFITNPTKGYWKSLEKQLEVPKISFTSRTISIKPLLKKRA